MKKLGSLLLAILFLLPLIPKGVVADTITFTPDAASLKKNPVPEWYRDAKFGIFIHWGIYSVPGYGDEWYGRHMYSPGSKHWAISQGYDQNKPLIYDYHKATYGSPQKNAPNRFGYADFLNLWKIDKYDPNEWADLFVQAGAKYVTIVGIHHDSFALWDSDVTPWNAVNKGLGTDNFGVDVENGNGRDLVGELQQAAKAKGLKFGISNHFAENRGWFPRSSAQDGSYDTDVTKNDPSGRQWLYSPTDMTAQEQAQRWLDITLEYIDKYHPDLTYFDSGLSWSEFNQVKRQFAAHYYNSAQIHNPEGVLFNYKGSTFTDGEAVLDIERGQLSYIRSMPWQTDTALSAKSWGYVEDDVFRNADYFLGSLIDIVSKNGCLMLNVGPKPDGTIPEEAKQILLDIGAWLQKNGEAIYATRPWVTFGEGPTVPGSYYSDNSLAFVEEDIRFTKSKDNKNLFISVLKKPSKNYCLVTTLKEGKFDATKIKKITLLETGEELTFSQNEEGLLINYPADYSQKLQHAFCMKLEFTTDYIPPLATDAFSYNEAENYYYGENIEKVHAFVDGSDAVKNTADGAYTQHFLNFGRYGATGITLQVSPDSQGKIEVRKDSPGGELLGTVNVTAGGSDYKTLNAVINAKELSGDQTICLVYYGNIKLNKLMASYRAVNMLIQAEDFDEGYGENLTLSDCPDGTKNLGYMNTGYWVKYSNFDFGDGISKIVARFATNTGPEPLCGIEFRIDSLDEQNTIASTGAGYNTGGWETYKTVTLDVTKEVKGTHDLYIYFLGPCNLNWFYMYPSGNTGEPWTSANSFESRPLGINTGIVVTEFEVRPFADKIDGVIGYTANNIEVSDWGHQAIVIRFNTDGFFDYRDYNAFVASSVPYEKNKTYEVKTIINLETRTYNAYAREKGEKEYKTICLNARFRDSAPVPSNIGKIIIRGGSGAPAGQFYVNNHRVRQVNKLEYTNFTQDGEKRTYNFYAAENLNPTFILAAYDTDGKLYSIITKKQSAVKNQFCQVDFPHLDPKYTYRLYVWNDIKNLTPVISPLEVK